MNKTQQKNTSSAFQLSKEGIEFVKKEMKRYETKLSAVIPCLYRVQEENKGWVSPASVSYLSKLMEISESQIYEVLTFYTMFNKEPKGPLHIQVCCNVTCAMKGGRELLENLKKHFKPCPKQDHSLQRQDNTDDKPVCTFSAVECLGSCDTAPVLQINREPYIENADLEKTVKLINSKI